MQTYVTSLHRNARHSHLGDEHRTVCRYVFMDYFQVTPEPTLPVCARCVAQAKAAADAAARRAARAAWYVDPTERAAAEAARDAAVVALLKQGMTNTAVARRLGLGLRTTVRRITDAQRRAGAASRFHFGYLIGRAEAAA